MGGGGGGGGGKGWLAGYFILFLRMPALFRTSVSAGHKMKRQHAPPVVFSALSNVDFSKQDEN